jgi:hypothetical protein
MSDDNKGFYLYWNEQFVQSQILKQRTRVVQLGTVQTLYIKISFG